MRVLSNTSFLFSCLSFLFGTVLTAQSFSYAILPSDTAIIIQQDYCGDSIQWQQFSNGSWADLAGEQQPSLQLTHQGPENEVKLFRSLTRFANDPVPKVSRVTSIRFATTFSELEVTDLYDGAHLYYVSPDTLLAATVTDYTAPWGCTGQIIEGADGIGMGTGQQNTLDIIEGCPETYTAALVCDTMTVLGHTDWYLPSADEANAISANLAAENIADFGFNDYLWTSTEAWSTLSTIPAEKAVRKLFPHEGYTYNYYEKSSVEKIVASRTILDPAPHTAYINSYLEEDALAGTIDVSPVAGSLNQFSVEYRGSHIEGADYEWDFRDGLVLEGGEGPGPHLLCYGFGGYRRLSAKVTSTACSSSTYKSYAFRPQVIENIEAPFPAVYNGTVAFTDFNNDANPDAFLIGSDTTVLYQNVGMADYEWVNVPFPPLSNAHAAWGDYDNDGWSDVLFCGITPVDSIPQTYLFRNDEGFQFTEIPTILPAISDGFVEWLDYNNDGVLDILLSGKGVDQQPLTQLFQGDKNGQFTEVATPFPALLNSNVALEDFNKDNYVDLLLLGKNDTTRYCRLYENDQGVFADTGMDFLGLDNGAAAWADFNDDGLLDFYVTGNQEDIIVEQPSQDQLWVSLLGSVYGEIYLQEEGGQFDTLENPYHSRSLRYAFNSLETGDFDHDGKSDILTAGMPWVAWLEIDIGGGPQDTNDWTHRSKPSVFRNLGDGFTNLELDMPSLYINGSPAAPYASDSLKQTVMSSFETSSATFGDFNQDGTLDIFREGNGMDETSAIYQNESCLSNSPPTIPAGLTATILNCDSVRLDWQAVSDDHTLASNITYEVYVGTSPGSGDILSQKNKRKLRNTFFELANLTDGTYFWSVKAVDGAKTSSAYAAEGQFEIDCLVNASEDAFAAFDCELSPNPFQQSLTLTLVGSRSTEVARYDIINPLGQLVQSGQFTQTVSVPIAGEASGVYVVQICIGEQHLVRKVIKL